MRAPLPLPPAEPGSRVVRYGRTRLRRALWVWAAAWFLAESIGGAYSWHYFVTGSQTLLAGGPGGGLHVFAQHPELQVGPVSLLAAAPFAAAGLAGQIAVQALLCALGVVLVEVLADLAVRLHPGRRGEVCAWAAGVLVVPGWAVLGVHYTHLDDALALAATLLAVRAAVRGGSAAVGALLGLAVASKPWAVLFVPLLLALPARRRTVAATLTVVVAAGFWAPFVLADPRTLTAAGYRITVAPDSVLRLVAPGASATPAWDRPAQLLLGLAAATLAARRGRWLAVPVVGVAARLLLDPQTYPYYTTGFVLAAALVDVGLRREALPTWTALAVLTLVVAPAVGLPTTAAALLRAGVCLGVLVRWCAGPAMREPRLPRRPQGPIARAHALAGAR